MARLMLLDDFKKCILQNFTTVTANDKWIIFKHQLFTYKVIGLCENKLQPSLWYLHVGYTYKYTTLEFCLRT